MIALRYTSTCFSSIELVLLFELQQKATNLDVMMETAVSKCFQALGAPYSQKKHCMLTRLCCSDSKYDPVWGGFGAQPKFPRPVTLNLLLRVFDQGLTVLGLALFIHYRIGCIRSRKKEQIDFSRSAQARR